MREPYWESGFNATQVHYQAAATGTRPIPIQYNPQFHMSYL